MQPAIIRGHNRRFTAPDGRDDVVTLFAREDRESGFSMLRTAWGAEQTEAGFLLAGAKLHLGIAASIHPVVNLSVADLPEEFDPVFTVRRFECVERGPVVRAEAIIADKPLHLRLWAERPIVAGFCAALLDAIGAIEDEARLRGFEL